MPFSRKSCDRCRDSKLKCEWIDDSGCCARCQKRSLSCVSPDASDTAKPPTTRQSSSGLAALKTGPAVTNSSVTAVETLPEVDSRVERLEQLVEQLRHSLDKTRANKSDADLLSLISVPRPHHQDDVRHPSPSALGGEGRPAKRQRVSDRTRGFVTEVEEDPDARPDHQLALDQTLALSPPSPPPGLHGLDNCSRKTCYLPPVEEGWTLAKEYLHHYNSKMPLLSPDAVFAAVRGSYSGAADKTRLSWVLTYVIFGIAIHVRVKAGSATENDLEQGRWYLSRCLQTLPDLLLHDPTLRLIQAVLGVAILLQMSSRSRRSALFVSTAMHMIQDLRYQELSPSPEGTIQDDDRAKAYVFWIAFFMDADISLAAMRSSSQRLADISTPLPELETQDWWAPRAAVEGGQSWKFNVFAIHTQLAMLQTEALESFFSVSARQQPPEVTVLAYTDILAKLEDWRSSNILFSLEPEEVRQSVCRSDMAHCMFLLAAHLRTVYQIQVATEMGWSSPPQSLLSSEKLRAMMAARFPGCYNHARHFLTLTALLPARSVCTVWATTDALIIALCAVLVQHVPECEGRNLIQGDSEAYALTAAGTTEDPSEDLGVCARNWQALELAAQGSEDHDQQAAIRLCRELYERLAYAS